MIYKNCSKDVEIFQRFFIFKDLKFLKGNDAVFFCDIVSSHGRHIGNMEQGRLNVQNDVASSVMYPVECQL